MRRILLITSRLPWPLSRNGGAQRTELLRRALSAHGHVDVVGFGPGATDTELAAAHVTASFSPADVIYRQPPLLGGLGRMAATLSAFEGRYARHQTLAEWVHREHSSRPYNLIVSRYLAPGLQAGIQKLKGVPLIVDFDDVDWQTLRANLQTNPWPGIKGKVGSMLVLMKIKSLCNRSLTYFGHIWVTSDEDRKLIPRLNCTVLPNIPFTETCGQTIEPLQPSPDSQELLFVGDLQYAPNRDGLDRFLTKIWPTINTIIPRATVTVVGRGLTDGDRVRWASIPGTDIVGYADDLKDNYARCAFTIVPVYFGGGTKIKILESLAFGRTVVTTAEAARGYDLLAKHRCIAVAGTNDEFISACVAFLQRTDLRNACARSGNQFVAREFSFSHFRDVVDKTVADLAIQRGAHPCAGQQ